METGSRIPIWRTFVSPKQESFVSQNTKPGACPTAERSTILIHVCGSLHCWTTQRQWSDPRFVDRFLDSIHATEITSLCVYIALLLLLLLSKMAEKVTVLLFDVSKCYLWSAPARPTLDRSTWRALVVRSIWIDPLLDTPQK